MNVLKNSHAFKDFERQKGDSIISIPNYIRNYIISVENGHDIIIVSGDVGRETLMKIKCRWPKGKNPRTKPFTEMNYE